MRTAEILPAHFREWVSEMNDAGITPPRTTTQDHPVHDLHDRAERLRDRMVLKNLSRTLICNAQSAR
jgi:hypothetical protein